MNMDGQHQKSYKILIYTPSHSQQKYAHWILGKKILPITSPPGIRPWACTKCTYINSSLLYENVLVQQARSKTILLSKSGYSEHIICQLLLHCTQYGTKRAFRGLQFIFSQNVSDMYTFLTLFDSKGDRHFNGRCNFLR